MKTSRNWLLYLTCAGLLAAGALVTVGCQKNQQNSGSAENLSVKWTALGTLKSLEKASRDKILLGVMKNVKKNYWSDVELNGYPCRIAVFSGKDSPWIGGAPSFEIYLRRPENPKGSQAKDPIFDNPRFTAGRDERDPEGVPLHGSNSPIPHLMKREDGSRIIRFWTSSGHFILTRSGYSDLNFNREGELVAATFGDYTPSFERSAGKKESLSAQCVLNEPFSF